MGPRNQYASRRVSHEDEKRLSGPPLLRALHLGRLQWPGNHRAYACHGADQQRLGIIGRNERDHMLFAELLELPMVGLALDGQTVLALVATYAASHAVFVGTSLSEA